MPHFSEFMFVFAELFELSERLNKEGLWLVFHPSIIREISPTTPDHQ